MKGIPKTSFFTRLILSYAILAIVLIGLAGGYLYTQANRLLVDEIARDSQFRLVTAKDYIEKTVLRKFEINIQNEALSNIFTQSEFNLNYLLNNSWEGNLSRVRQFALDLGILKSLNEGAYSMTVYFAEGNWDYEPINTGWVLSNRFIYKMIMLPLESTVGKETVEITIKSHPWSSMTT